MAPLPQSSEVCRSWLLAPGAPADRLPVTVAPRQLGGTTHGGVDSRANGHVQRRHLRGFCAASHKASFWHQRRALQKAGLPHELQAARTFTDELMTVGSTPNIRTLQIPPPPHFYCFLSKTTPPPFFFLFFLNIETSTDTVSADHQLFQRRLCSSWQIIWCR